MAEAVYQYDAGGRLQTAMLLNDVDTTGRIAYAYDAGGNLAREVWRFAQGWTQTFVYEYVPTTCRMWSIPNPLDHQHVSVPGGAGRVYVQ